MDLPSNFGSEHHQLGGRVAFFGGSFDPPHLGHLAVARAAQAALDLETVLFAPVGAQPLKPQGSTANFADRVAMTRLAIAGEPGFAISLLDAPKPFGQPNYTIDALIELRAMQSGAGEVFCLVGADAFAQLRFWHRAAEIPFVAPLIVASRPSEFLSSLDNLAAVLPDGLSVEPASELNSAATPIPLRRWTLRNSAGELTPLYLLPGLDVEISASEIRTLVLQHAESNSAERELLSPPVSEYIRAHGLYL
jgi:nicotinate-nucleotide adenylyltransferase